MAAPLRLLPRADAVADADVRVAGVRLLLVRGALARVFLQPPPLGEHRAGLEVLLGAARVTALVRASVCFHMWATYVVHIVPICAHMEHIWSTYIDQKLIILAHMCTYMPHICAYATCA